MTWLSSNGLAAFSQSLTVAVWIAFFTGFYGGSADPASVHSQRNVQDREDLAPGVFVVRTAPPFSAAGRVHDFMVAPHKPWIVTCHEQGCAVWDEASEELLHSIHLDDFPVSVGFVPDTDWAVLYGMQDAAVNERVFFVVDCGRGKLIRQFTVPDVEFLSCFSAIHPAKRELAVAVGKAVAFYNLESGKLLRKWSVEQIPLAIAYDGVGDQMTIGFRDRIALVEAESGEQVDVVRTPGLSTYASSFFVHRDWNELFVCELAKPFAVVDVIGCRERELDAEFTELKRPKQAGVSSSGNRFFVANAPLMESNDAPVILVGDTASKSLVGNIELPGQFLVKAEFTHEGDGLLVFTYGQTGLTKVSLVNGQGWAEKIARSNGIAHQMAFFDGGKSLAVADLTGGVHLIDMPTGKQTQSLNVRIHRLAIDDVGEYLLGIDEWGVLSRWKLKDGSQSGKLELGYTIEEPMPRKLINFVRGDEPSAPEHGRISQFELSGDGRHVLISMIGNRQRGRLAMWNHGQERLVYSKDFNSARGDFTRLSQWGISPDGQRVATIRQNHLELLDAWTATLVNRIAIHRIGSDGLTWCCKNPNHVLVVDNTDVLFADLQADEVRHVTRLDPGRHGILSNLFCVSRDGTRMLIVDSRLRDPRAIVIDLEAGEIVVDRPLELQQIFGAAISPNGKTAAFGLGDGRILIWELEQLSRSLRNP